MNHEKSPHPGLAELSDAELSDADLSDADIDALLFSLLDSEAAEFSKAAELAEVVEISRWRRPSRRVGISVAAAAIAAVSLSTAWMSGLIPAERDSEVQLAADPAEISAADFNPQLLSSVAKGKEYSGLAEPSTAAECVAVNVKKLNENGLTNSPHSNTFSGTISPLKYVVGAAPVTYDSSVRQLFVLQLPGEGTGEGTTPALWALITDSECGRIGATGEPEAATVHVAALS